MGVGVGGGPGGTPSEGMGGYGNPPGNFGMSYGGGGTGESPGMPPAGPAVTAAIPSLPSQSVMSAQDVHALNEAIAQQSLMSADEASAHTAEALTGMPFGANTSSFGYGNIAAPAGGGGIPNGNFLGKAVSLLTSIGNFAFPLGLFGKAGLTFAGNTIASLLEGKNAQDAVRGGVIAAATSALPFAGLLTGNLPSDQTGDVTGLGFGLPANVASMAEGMVGQGVAQGMTPGVGAVAPPAVPMSVPSKVISPSPVAQSYYGMKRVNLPWVNWPQAQNKEYGMKRV